MFYLCQIHTHEGMWGGILLYEQEEMYRIIHSIQTQAPHFQTDDYYILDLYQVAKETPLSLSECLLILDELSPEQIDILYASYLRELKKEQAESVLLWVKEKSLKMEELCWLGMWLEQSRWIVEGDIWHIEINGHTESFWVDDEAGRYRFECFWKGISKAIAELKERITEEKDYMPLMEKLEQYKAKMSEAMWEQYFPS